jgi:hypothetical protein
MSRDNTEAQAPQLASGIDASIVAEIAHPHVDFANGPFNGGGCAVMPSSWTESARRS